MSASVLAWPGKRNTPPTGSIPCLLEGAPPGCEIERVPRDDRSAVLTVTLGDHLWSVEEDHNTGGVAVLWHGSHGSRVVYRDVSEINAAAVLVTRLSAIFGGPDADERPQAP